MRDARDKSTASFLPREHVLSNMSAKDMSAVIVHSTGLMNLEVTPERARVAIFDRAADAPSESTTNPHTTEPAESPSLDSEKEAAKQAEK